MPAPPTFRNMFLAAAPYFQKRFSSNEWMSENSQSAILTVSTITNLTSMLILSHIQSSASYPFRVCAGLATNIGVFALLTLTAKTFLDVSAGTYFVFLLLMVACSSWATGLIQNGAFAYAASFSRSEYLQAIMAGQGVAGVLPPLVQMISVLVAPPAVAGDPDTQQPPPDSPASPPLEEASTSAFIYFLTAVIVSSATLVAFVPLVRRHERKVRTRAAAAEAAQATGAAGSAEDAGPAPRRFVSIPTLLRKLHWVAAAVFLCFAITMFYPVFTAKILSVRGDGAGVGRLFTPEVFIPLGFFVWNLGDLAGRVSTILPFSLRHRPAALFAISIARVLFLPLFMLCNIRGRGAAVSSDAFYLLVVQFPFGLTNGWLGSSAMMAAAEWVEDGEKEAAGAFMGLCLVAGLAAGSILSFTAAGV